MTQTRLRLASYNIRKCVGLDRRRRPGRILDLLNGLDADVIALQEADLRLGRRPAALPADMIAEHSDFTAVTLPGHEDSLGWHGNAILVRRGLHVGAVRALDLPGTEPRGAVMAEVAGLRVVGLHLGLLRRDRRRQLAALRATLPDDDMPTAILGDFNEWSARRGLEPLADLAVHSPGRSFHAARPMAALDRVALSRQIELRDAAVVETPQSRIASDHLPIWADLALPTSAPAS